MATRIAQERGMLLATGIAIRKAGLYTMKRVRTKRPQARLCLRGKKEEKKELEEERGIYPCAPYSPC